jgi:NDP-sugar pyrophosphorylase family protein
MNGGSAEIAPQAVIMAGGEGRRLGALTAQVPKPMLPVGDRPLLQRQIEQLRNQGVLRIVLAVRYRADTILEHFGDGSSLGVQLRYVVETQPLGTAGALGLLEPWPDPLLVLNGDILADIPVRPLLKHHEKCVADITIGSTSYEFPVPYGVLDGTYPFVTTIREAPSLTFMVNAGVYVLSPSVHDHFRPVRPVHMPEIVEAVLTEGCVANYRLPGPWIDIGTQERYALACSQFPGTFGPTPVAKPVAEQRRRGRGGASQISASAVGERRDQ